MFIGKKWIGRVVHLTDSHGYEVGDYATGICGKEFKVKQIMVGVTNRPTCGPCFSIASVEANQREHELRNMVARILRDIRDTGNVLGITDDK